MCLWDIGETVVISEPCCIAMVISSLKALDHSMNLPQLVCSLIIHSFDLGFSKIPPRRSTNICQPVPFIHAKLSNTDFDIQPIIILYVDTTFTQTFLLHVLMGILATLDLCYKSSPSFGKITHEFFIPQMLLGIGTSRSFSSSYTDEHPNFSTRPLVNTRFFEDDRGGVVLSRPLVNKYRLTDLNRFEGKTCSTCCAAGLPYRAVGFWRSFFAGVIGTEDSWSAAFSSSFVNGSYHTDS